MLLGSVITGLQDETVALDTLLALDDLVLLARVQEAADEQSGSAGRVRQRGDRPVHQERMMRRGSPDDRCLARRDPGGAALKCMLDYSLRRGERAADVEALLVRRARETAGALIAVKAVWGVWTA